MDGDGEPHIESASGSQLNQRRRVYRAGRMWPFQEQASMNKHQQPTKESVREWLRAEVQRRRPPPDPSQIRRELGWELVRTVPPCQKR